MDRVAKKRIYSYPARFGIEIDNVDHHPDPSNAATSPSPRSRSYPFVVPQPSTTTTFNLLPQVFWPNAFLESPSLLLGVEPLTSLCFSSHLPILRSVVEGPRSRLQPNPSVRTQGGVDQVNKDPPHPSLSVDDGASDSPLLPVQAPVTGVSGVPVCALPPHLVTASNADEADEEWCALRAFLSEPSPRAHTEDNHKGQMETNAGGRGMGHHSTFNTPFIGKEQLRGLPLSAPATPDSTHQQHNLLINGCDQPGLGYPVQSSEAVLEIHPSTAAPQCVLLPPSPHTGHLWDKERHTHPTLVDQVNPTPTETPKATHLLPTGLPSSQSRPRGPIPGEADEGQFVNTRASGGGRVDQANAGQGQGRGTGVGIPRSEDGEVMMPSHVRGAMFQSWMHIGVEMWDMGLTLGLDRILHRLVISGEDPDTSPSSQGREGEEGDKSPERGRGTINFPAHSDITPSPERRDRSPASETDFLAHQHQRCVSEMGARGISMCQPQKAASSPAKALPESVVQHVNSVSAKSPEKAGERCLSLVMSTQRQYPNTDRQLAKSTERHKPMQGDRDDPYSNGSKGACPRSSTCQVPLSQRLACTLGAIQAQNVRKRKQVEIWEQTPHVLEEGQRTTYNPVIKAADALNPITGSLTTPKRNLAHLDAASKLAGSAVQVEASCARQGKLPLPFPQPVPPQGMEVNMKQRMLLAAAALESGNKEAFSRLCSQLKPHGRKAGTASQRFAHLMLQALRLRQQGNVYEFLKKSSHFTFKDLHNAYMWGYTSTPVIPFSIMSTISMLVPKLLGHSRVHLINIGKVFLPHVPTLMRLLVACPGLLKTQKGKNVRLSSFRVTSINFGNLFRPEKREVKPMKVKSEIEIFLRGVAESLGVNFEFQMLDIDELNVSSLGGVTPRRGEVVGVCAIQSLKNASDEAPICALQETLKCLVRVNPEIVAFSDEDCDGNSKEYLPRFSAVMDFTWARMHAHDAVTSQSNKSKETTLSWYEQFWFAPGILKALSCERRDRRVRPRSSLGWKHAFVSAGFRPVTVGYPLLEGVLHLIQSYPVGFHLSTVEETIVLNWRGSPLACACGFELY